MPEDTYLVRVPRTKGKRIIKVNAISFAKLVEAMLDGTMTCKELSEHTGLHYSTVLQYTREMHRAGACHISQWEKDDRGRDIMRVYKIGMGKDAKRQKMTGVERSARYRSKLRQQDLIQRTAG